jgi:hypothetical protein
LFDERDDVSKPLSGRSLLQGPKRRPSASSNPNCLQTAKRSFTFASHPVHSMRKIAHVSKPLSGRSLLQETQALRQLQPNLVSKPLSGRSLLQDAKIVGIVASPRLQTAKRSFTFARRKEGCDMLASVFVSKPLSGRSLLQAQSNQGGWVMMSGLQTAKRSFTFASLPWHPLGRGGHCLQTAKRSFTFASGGIWGSPGRPTHVSKPLSGRSLLQVVIAVERPQIPTGLQTAKRSFTFARRDELWRS